MNLLTKKYLQKPIIFIGSPRSGTSVISEIIMRHNDLAFPSQYQTRFKKKTAINFLRRLFDNKLWRVHGQKKQLNKVNLINRFVFRPVEGYVLWDAILEKEVDFRRNFLLHKKAGPENVTFLRRFFGKIVKRQGKKRLSFKVTGPSRIEFLSSIFPDAQFVRIIREPVATVSSLLNIHFWKNEGIEQLWWKGAYNDQELKWVKENSDNQIALTAFQLKKIQEVTEEEIDRCSAAVLNIHYSEFVTDPDKIIGKILDFTNLNHDKACYGYLKENKIFNRNRKNKEYFNSTELETIHEIFSS